MKDIELKWSFRPQQVETLEVFDKFLSNEKKKFFFINAPVGTGKSYSIVAMADTYRKRFGESLKFDVVTNTKILQDQYLRDFDFMESIKGVDNYYCETHNTNCSNGMELYKANPVKNKCNGTCPYKDAKLTYLNSSIGVLNFHLFVNYWIYTSEMMSERNSKVLFVDEAHSFEEVYCGFIDSFLSEEYLIELGVWKQVWKDELYAIKNVNSFASFTEKVVVEIKTEQNKFINILRSCNDISESIQLANKIKHLSRAACKYNRLLKNKEDWNSNWKLQIDKTNKEKWTWKVEAIWGKKYLRELWDKYDKVVFLSGTMLDKMFFMNIMGCEPEESLYIELDSPFKIENRKIIAVCKEHMSFDRKREAFLNVVEDLKQIIQKHSGQKGIIHTSNYELARWIQEEIQDPRLLFHDNTNKDYVLNRHVLSKDSTILVSPAMINGVDLKDDLSRFQIILKVPFPNLSNVKVKERMESNPKWYSWKTMCDIIQQYGRSIRSEQDYAVTYIMDANFLRLIQKVRLPEYIKQAIFYE